MLHVFVDGTILQRQLAQLLQKDINGPAWFLFEPLHGFFERLASDPMAVPVELGDNELLGFVLHLHGAKNIISNVMHPNHFSCPSTLYAS